MALIKFMRCALLDLIFAAYFVVAISSERHKLIHTVKRFPSISRALGTCTLKSSGGDDGPAFAAALVSDQCSTVTIPAGTTLSIASPLKTTATNNKHISLAGTLSFTNDTVSYLTFYYAFADTEVCCVRRTGNNIRSNSLIKMPQYVISVVMTSNAEENRRRLSGS
jgi:hypothetical protein